MRHSRVVMGLAVSSSVPLLHMGWWMERGLRIRHNHRDLKQASPFAGEKESLAVRRDGSTAKLPKADASDQSSGSDKKRPSMGNREFGLSPTERTAQEVLSD